MPTPQPNEASGEFAANSIEYKPEEADRSVHVVTEFSDYFFRVRHPARIQEYAALAVELEPKALELWAVSDSREYDDLLDALSASPLSPQLVAVMMLTGRSKLQAKSDAALGGGAKRENTFGAIKEKLQSDWGSYSGKLTKRGFAMRRYKEWDDQNAELKRMGRELVPLPAPDTPQKWLANVPNALKKEKLQRIAERNAEQVPTGAALVGQPVPSSS